MEIEINCKADTTNENIRTILLDVAKEAKPEAEKKHMDLLNLRYDLINRTAKGVIMSRGKAVQEVVRIKLSKGMTWEKLAAMSPEVEKWTKRNFLGSPLRDIIPL